MATFRSPFAVDERIGDVSLVESPGDRRFVAHLP